MSTTNEPRFDRWLKIVLGITGAISAVLALVPQTSNLFGPFDYGAEVLLAIASITLTIFGISLIRGKSSNHILGIIVVIAAPVFALLLWYALLRLSPEKEEIVRKELALGDTELNILNNPKEARNHYRNALLLAPRRGSIRVKIQDAEDRMKGQ